MVSVFYGCQKTVDVGNRITDDNISGNASSISKSNENITKKDSDMQYVFESNETQKVFKNGSNYMFLYYNGSIVIGIDTVMTFQDEESAHLVFETLKDNDNPGVDKTEIDGKYVILHMNDSYVSEYNYFPMGDWANEEDYLSSQGYELV